MMKRTLTLMLLLLAMVASTFAQQGLRVADIFNRFGHEKGCKMVEMHDARLRGYTLKTYQSLTYRTQGEQIAPLLEDDRRQATKIREVISDGRVSSGYYIMSPSDNGLNRYILYTLKQDNSGAVIYIEGKLLPDDILKMCYQTR